MSEMFRIGGYYRQKNGVVVKVIGPHKGVMRDEGAWVQDADDLAAGMKFGSGFRSLLNGRDYLTEFGTERDLLPGELHCVNGEWVPIEDPELIALQTRPQHVPAMCDEKPATSLGAILRQALERGIGGKPAASSSEPKRAPLPGYGHRTPFDPFGPGYTVSSDCAVEAQPGGCFAGVRLDACQSFKAPRAL